MKQAFKYFVVAFLGRSLLPVAAVEAVVVTVVPGAVKTQRYKNGIPCRRDNEPGNGRYGFSMELV